MLGYTYWHQLFVHSCISCLLSMHMFMLLLFSYLFIMLFSYLLSIVYLVIILCTLFICTSSPFYTHTHQVAFWWPWICTSKYWTLCFYCSGVGWDHTYCEELESLSDSGILISLFFLLFSYSWYIRFSCYSTFFHLYDIMCGCLDVILQ